MRPRLPLLLLIGFALLLTQPAAGQASPDVFEDAAYEALIALEEEDWATAIAQLEPIVAADPTYLSADLEGSAAYWLGQAYIAQDRPREAHATWQQGLTALDEQGLFDAQLAEAFVRSTFTGGYTADEDLASRAFVALLDALDTLPGRDAYPLLEPHLTGLQLIVPAAIQTQLGLDTWIQSRGSSALAPEAGARLSAWWRGQDVSPATPLNERLLEHLRRVAYAQQQYALEARADERGPLYVRLGAPTKVTEVQFDRTRFRNKVIDASLSINISDFYANEFWYYDHLGPDVQFLFINKDGAFKLGTVRDLLPPAVRSGIGPSQRGLRKAEATARTLEEIYRQLSIHDSDYGSRYTEVASFVSLLDDSQSLAEAEALQNNQSRQINAGSSGETQRRTSAATQRGSNASATTPGTSFSSGRPDLFVLSALSQGVAEDDQLTLRREENTPDSFSNEFDDAEPLPATVRHARFLDPDGTTRTELYWGVPPGGLEPSRRMRRAIEREGHSTEDYLMVATLSQRDAAYQARTIEQRRHVLPDIGSTPQASLAPLTYTLAGDTSLYHVAVQFEQYAARLRPDGTPLEVGPRVLVNTTRLDSLQALSADPATLEMSDLKPMVVPDEVLASSADWLEGATVYPGATIQESATLLLYFELYHLTFGAEEQTRYRVEYEVARQERSLLRGRDTVLTSASTDYQGRSRRAEDYIALDLTEFAGADRLSVTVRVTDQTTGQTVERSIEFEVD